MSNNFVERFCHRHFQKNPKKSKEEILNNLTHLYLNGRKLEEIGVISCERLRVLYLHNNSIQRIANLNNLSKLTHLYLQWNRITRIENLTNLKHLKKLYLSYNRLNRLEGIENSNELEELHLERQYLDGNPFTFDSSCLDGISASLRFLNISGLSLTDSNFLESLPNLIDLIATENRFSDTDQICRSISYLNFLRSAQFSGCPAQLHDIHYRSKITLASNSLLLLDNKPIKGVFRTFLKNFEKAKFDQRKKQQDALQQLQSKIVDIDLRDEADIFVDSVVDTFEFSAMDENKNQN